LRHFPQTDFHFLENALPHREQLQKTACAGTGHGQGDQDHWKLRGVAFGELSTFDTLGFGNSGKFFEIENPHGLRP
jgi:hypothetical protein